MSCRTLNVQHVRYMTANDTDTHTHRKRVQQKVKKNCFEGEQINERKIEANDYCALFCVVNTFVVVVVVVFGCCCAVPLTFAAAQS